MKRDCGILALCPNISRQEAFQARSGFYLVGTLFGNGGGRIGSKENLRSIQRGFYE